MTTPTFNCIETEAHLPLFVGEDLDVAAMQSVREHLAGCAPCQANLSALRAALSAFEVERERRDSVVDLWPGVEAELARLGVIGAATPALVRATDSPSPRESAQAAPSVAPSRRAWWRHAASFAAAAAIVVVAFRNWSSTTQNPGEHSTGAPSPARIDTPATAFATPTGEAASVGLATDQGSSSTDVASLGVETPAGAAFSASADSPSDALNTGGLRRLAPGEALLSEELRVRQANAYSLAGDHTSWR